MDSKMNTGNEEKVTNSKVKEYKSEYKKQFLPFSQYEYIDGKFFKKKNNQETESPWYKEVIELRQKAGEYKFRGWGTELGTTVVVPAFNHQLWKHVSHKSSFNALALITTTSRALTKKDKSKENCTASAASSTKPGIRRPHTATPKHPMGSEVDGPKTWKEDELKSTKGKQVKPLIRASQNKARSQSAEPGLRYKRNLPSKQGSSGTATTSSSGAPGTSTAPSGDRENVVGASWKPKDGDPSGDSSSLAKHRRPTTLSTSPRSRSTASSSGSRNQSKSTIRQHFNKGSVDRSLDGTDEIVVKSPPEPTRVKSPEQVKLRSPDPVNWMVPLDTAKGFTVTQIIPKGPAVGGA